MFINYLVVQALLYYNLFLTLFCKKTSDDKAHVGKKVVKNSNKKPMAIFDNRGHSSRILIQNRTVLA